MSYTAEDLLDIFRVEVDDTAEDYLWTDDMFFGYLDEAQKEFARQTDILKVTDITIPLVAGEAFIELPQLVEKIRSVILTSSNKQLAIRNYDELLGSRQCSDYGNDMTNLDKKGTPRFFVADEVTDQLRIVPIPNVADNVRVTAFVLPTLDIVDDGSELQLTDSSHQRALLMFCKSMAYEVHDSDTQDLQKADRYKQQFYQYTALVKSRRARRNRRVGTVRYAGI